MKEILFIILVQGLGVLGIICSTVSFQFKGHRMTMIFRTLNEMFFGVQYIFLGAYTGSAMNFIGSARNIAFAELVKRNRSTLVPRILFSVIFAVFIAFTWAGPKSLLSGLAKIVSTFIYGNKNTTVIRIGIFFTCSMWLVYNIFVGSIAGVICEAFALISIIVGMFRLDKKTAPVVANECESED